MGGQNNETTHYLSAHYFVFFPRTALDHSDYWRLRPPASPCPLQVLNHLQEFAMSIQFGGTVATIVINGEELQDPHEINTYEREVQDQLRDVVDVFGNGKFKTGQWLVRELNKSLTIRPALAHKLDAAGNQVMDLQQHPVYDPSKTDLNASCEATAPDKANVVNRLVGIRGLGSDSLIRYSPDVWWYLDARRLGFDANRHSYVQVAPNERYYLGEDKRSCEPDDILFHEMFHAYRQMQGLWTNDRLDDDFGRKEEFFAVVVTNIYVSERNGSTPQRELRGNYARASATAPAFQDLDNDPRYQDDSTHHFSTRKFLDKYEDAIGELVGDMSNVFLSRLASVQAEFNPIALYLERHPDKNPDWHH